MKKNLAKTKGSQRNFNYTKSPEYGDLEVVLNQFKNTNSNVLFIIPPVNCLNDIREELVKHSFNFYSEFCIQKDFMLVYVPTKINNKIAQYTLAIVNTNCQIFYSNRSTGGENEIIKFISKEDNNNLKRYDAISRYFINRRIFLFFCMLFTAILLLMIYSNVLVSNEIYLIVCLLLVNLLLSFLNFVYKDLFCNEILANEVSLFISFEQIEIKASTK